MMKPNSPIRRARTVLMCGFLIGSFLFAPVFPQAGVMQQIRYGTVVSVSQAVVKTGPTGVGAAVGGTAGALAGAAIGRRGGSWFGGMLGGVLGGVAGHAIEKAASKKKGVELIIQMEDGGEIGIQLPKVQAGVYRQGDRVRMMTDRRGKTQVTVVEG